MASIAKRNGKFCVVYYYTDSLGARKQKWETFNTQKEALKRKAEVEGALLNDTFVPPNKQTVEEFLAGFVSLYGEKHWGVSYYDSNTSLIKNYINPIIGQKKVQDINVRFIDEYYKNLKQMNAVLLPGKKPKLISDETIRNIHKLLKSAFNQAVKWEIILRNPFNLVTLEKKKYNTREILSIEKIQQLLDACQDKKLYVAINLAVAGPLRIGECCGLTWDNVYISDEDILSGNARVEVEKELARCTLEAIERLDEKDIIKIFPASPGRTTCMVLKKPKTESSIRTIWIPKTLAYILRNWRMQQKKNRDFLGKEYQVYDGADFVLTQTDGRMCETGIISKSFGKLIRKLGFPEVVFHSLRHSSTSFKLKLNNGDLKATQGDTGHAEINMITDIYAHIQDEDRRKNAQKFDEAFYQTEKSNEADEGAEQLVALLKSKPELVEKLTRLLSEENQ